MKHVHILGICGTFMGGLAAIAREAGYRVTGSDRNIYPPMSDQLRALGIELVDGFEADQLDMRPDMVIVGNVVSRGMPVVEALLDRRIPYMSGPEWLAHHVLRDRWVIAVSGTHGKTTTTSLLAWIFEQSGRDAGFLIGGMPVDFPCSARLGSDPVFVIEADEYDTAFFDKRPKFLHYRPRTLVINNIEFDHADIYPDVEAIIRQFHQLLRGIAGNGLLVVPAGDRHVESLLSRGCWTPKVAFAGRDDVAGADWVAAEDPPGTLRIMAGGQEAGRCAWRLRGAHNAENALAALLAARHAGVPVAAAMAAIGSCNGVRRRLQCLGEFGQVQLFDDFAHHPTAIRRTVDALRSRRDLRRVLAVFEPRSNSMKLGIHAETLGPALGAADIAFVYRPPGLTWDMRVALRDVPEARICDDTGDIVAAVVAACRPGDAVLVMSNGDFAGIRETLKAALQARARDAGSSGGSGA